MRNCRNQGGTDRIIQRYQDDSNRINYHSKCKRLNEEYQRKEWFGKVLVFKDEFILGKGKLIGGGRCVAGSWGDGLV